ncbi:hypothetical protein AWB90_20100 [Mycobacterium paraense]|uniref:Uncharacterized protein n=1 Tax=Mycobacterium paraense TaxID=767916 RepID=A0A1X2A634_9MYCO|nr:hypothetical protein AWB90_20100 [Mycobacterium paraense]
MRVVLPPEVIRRMDSLILRGVGGFVTRGEFVLDAVQERLTELGGSGLPTVETGSEAPGQVTRGCVDPAQKASLASVFNDTCLRAEGGWVMTEPIDRPIDGHLFGLHNRDYPTLWVATLLAAASSTGPVGADRFFDAVASQAWTHGSLLQQIEKEVGSKCSALFPTNPEKKKASEGAFRSFAIGRYEIRPGGEVSTEGPLFQWRMAGLAYDGDELVIGMTEQGRSLLQAIDGLSVREPHGIDHALVFLRHVASVAPKDWACFAELLRCVGNHGASRSEVIKHFRKVRPEWTENEAATNSAGYVARSKEWGLLQPKQSAAKYLASDIGLDIVRRIETELTKEVATSAR